MSDRLVLDHPKNSTTLIVIVIEVGNLCIGKWDLLPLNIPHALAIKVLICAKMFQHRILLVAAPGGVRQEAYIRQMFSDLAFRSASSVRTAGNVDVRAS
jgi:hypothetical protein